MDPSSAAGGILSGFASAGAGIAGALTQAQGEASRQALLAQILSNYSRLGTPNLTRETALLLPQSAQAGVTTDPALQAAQLQSLGQLQDEASTGGQTLADRASMQLGLNEANQQSASRQAALQNMLAARGLGSSGAAMGLMASGGRQADQTAANTALQSQVAARQRALQGMQQSGALAGQVRGQQFQERSTAAQARDAWNRYNTGALQNAQNYNNTLPQQDWNNKMQLTGAEAGIMGTQANTQYQDANRLAGTISDMGSGFGQAAGGIANQFAGSAKKGPSTSYSMIDPSSQPEFDY